MIEELNTKTQPVSKEQVWTAWKHVKQGGKGMGIEEISMKEIASNPRKYLYPLWNRLASGSYFPPPVKRSAYSQMKWQGTNVGHTNDTRQGSTTGDKGRFGENS